MEQLRDLFLSRAPHCMMHEDFLRIILQYSSTVEYEYTGPIGHHVIPRDMDDLDIIKKIGERNIFSIEELLGLIERETNIQSKGEQGNFRTNIANTIFVRIKEDEIVSASVFWYQGNHKWNMHAGGYCPTSPKKEGSCIILKETLL